MLKLSLIWRGVGVGFKVAAVCFLHVQTEGHYEQELTFTLQKLNVMNDKGRQGLLFGLKEAKETSNECKPWSSICVIVTKDITAQLMEHKRGF